MMSDIEHIEPDELVPEAQVRREFGDVTPMTVWRWDHDPMIRFPRPVMIRKRKYRSRKELEEFKQRLLRDAIARRSEGS